MTVWNVEQCVLPMDLYFRVLQNNREHSQLLGWTWLDPATCKHKTELYEIRCTFFQLCCFKDFIFLQNHNLTHTSLLHISTVLGVQIVLRDLEGLPEIRDLKDHTHPSKWGGQDKNGWLWGLCITKVLCFYFVKAVTSVYPLSYLWL